MRLFLLLLLTIVPMASAQETSGPELGNVPDLISTGYLMQVIGSLAIVFGAVVLMAFVVKRFNRSPSVGKTHLSVLGSTSVGTREKVVLLSVGNQQLLVGVAPGNVRALHVFSETVEAQDSHASNSADFSAVWQSVNPFGGTR